MVSQSVTFNMKVRIRLTYRISFVRYPILIANVCAFCPINRSASPVKVKREREREKEKEEKNR